MTSGPAPSPAPVRPRPRKARTAAAGPAEKAGRAREVFSLEFSEPPFAGEFDQRRFHFPSVKSDADQIEVVVAGERHDVLLPLFDAFAHTRELTARDDAGAAGFDV